MSLHTILSYSYYYHQCPEGGVKGHTTSRACAIATTSAVLNTAATELLAAIPRTGSTDKPMNNCDGKLDTFISGVVNFDKLS